MKPGDGRRDAQGRKVLLGVGLDGRDGHMRLTHGDDVVLVGGSEDTHARMQENVIRLDERLRKKGKSIATASAGELRDILHELHRK